MLKGKKKYPSVDHLLSFRYIPRAILTHFRSCRISSSKANRRENVIGAIRQHWLCQLVYQITSTSWRRCESPFTGCYVFDALIWKSIRYIHIADRRANCYSGLYWLDPSWLFGQIALHNETSRQQKWVTASYKRKFILEPIKLTSLSL